MIKSEKGISESLECIKKYQKELDEYIHSEKIKDDLGRLLGGFVPFDSLITSAKLAEEDKSFLGLRKIIKDLDRLLIEINDTIEIILPIYEKVGDSNFIAELERKGLLENLEKLFSFRGISLWITPCLSEMKILSFFINLKRQVSKKMISLEMMSWVN